MTTKGNAGPSARTTEESALTFESIAPRASASSELTPLAG